MVEFEIKPHVGLGPIKLGAARPAIRKEMAELGFPLVYTRGELDFFCDNSIQVEFDSEDCAEFIGVFCHPGYCVTYQGTNVFDIPAEELFALIAANDASGSHEMNAIEYVFPSQIVTLWNADEQYDRLGGEIRPVWGQVGLGNERYLEAIQRIGQ